MQRSLRTLSAYRPRLVTPSLGPSFYDVVEPAKFPSHTLRWRNQRAADSLGLGHLDDAAWIDHFARFSPLPANLPAPLALRYHGHQFQQYNSRLGDGRGFLFAQLVDDRERVVDLSTKGSGQTPWSRAGDGRLTLKGGVREILAAEMLEALGVTTSRALSLVETGEKLVRGDEPSPTRSSVLVRVVWSSMRWGTFQRVAHEEDVDAMKRLVELGCRTYFPTIEPSPQRMLAEIVRRTALLVGQWLAAGFVHGVLNSDNLNLTGESFDYGPWRFLPRHDPSFVAAYFDQSGLYAYGRQPAAVRWNLERLVEALSIVESRKHLEHALIGFEPGVMASFTRMFLWRLGLAPTNPIDDALLAQQILCAMRGLDLDWDRFLFDWEGGEAAASHALQSPLRGSYATPRFESLRRAWSGRAPLRARRLPAPVSMHIDEVERVWGAIDERDDWAPLHAKLADVRALGAHLGPPPAL